MAGAGDVNGDGFDDVVVAAPAAGNNSRAHSGSSYVIYGQETNGNLNLGSLGSRGFRIDGAAKSDFAGKAVAGAGDVNGDGFDDVIVGVPNTNNGGGADSGSSYVVYGQADRENLDLAALGSRGFRIDGAATANRSGAAVGGAGDLNRDGLDDVIIGAFGAANNGRYDSGSAYLVYGQVAGADLSLASLGDRGFRIDGAKAQDWAGDAVAGGGDVNGDGIEDLIIGAPGADNNGMESGSVYIVFRYLSLTVGRSGSGQGAVISSDSEINCGTVCFGGFVNGTEVTLTASPEPGSTFTGWTGACTGTDETCVVTMDQVREVTAEFTLIPRELTVNRTGNGQGQVTSSPAGIDCGSTCSAEYDHGTDVTLTANPEPGSTFTGWTGACTGTDETCVVTMDQAREVTAEFTLIPRELTVNRNGNGQGQVTSSPAGIDCGSTCSAEYNHGTDVTLTASPEPGSTFTGWTGACTGTDQTCVVTMDQAREVTAEFTVKQPGPRPEVCPAIKLDYRLAGFKPKPPFGKSSKTTGLRVRLRTGGRTIMRIQPLVRYRLAGKTRQARLKVRTVRVNGLRNLRFRTPAKMRKQFRRTGKRLAGSRVTLVMKATLRPVSYPTNCTQKADTKRLRTRVVQVSDRAAIATVQP